MTGSLRRLDIPDRDDRESIGDYLTKRLGWQRVCVLAQDFGEAREIARLSGTASVPDTLARSLETGLQCTDFTDEVALIAEARPDASVYSGQQSPDLLAQLHAAGITATFMGGEALLGRSLIEQAGEEARGTLLISPSLPASGLLYGFPPRTPTERSSSVDTESWYLAIILTRAVAAGATDRTSVRAFVRRYSGNGPIRRYGWNQVGELSHSEFMRSSPAGWCT